MSKKHDQVIEQRKRYLAERGWQSFVEGVWTRLNWEKDGVCNRRLTTAYRIQLKLDSIAKQLEESSKLESVSL